MNASFAIWALPSHFRLVFLANYNVAAALTLVARSVACVCGIQNCRRTAVDIEFALCWRCPYPCSHCRFMNVLGESSPKMTSFWCLWWYQQLSFSSQYLYQPPFLTEQFRYVRSMYCIEHKEIFKASLSAWLLHQVEYKITSLRSNHVCVEWLTFYFKPKWSIWSNNKLSNCT